MRDRWLSGKAYWHLANGGNGVDNPDQRIAEDCRLFLTGVLSEAMDLITNIVAVFSYVIVLWNLSSFALSLDFIGLDLEIPRYMLVAAFVYVALSTGLTHWLGKPLKSLYVEQQRREADFRFALARMRSNVDEIAMLGGEAAERQGLDRRFGEIMRNWKRLINRELILGLFTFPYNHTVLRIPLFVALPAYLAGSVNFGGLMEVSTAFSSVVTTLSWFIFSYRDLADLVAASSRLDGFLGAAGAATAGARPAPGAGPLTITDLRLRLPDNRPLLSIDRLSIAMGEAVWLSGASGLGKTTLFKAIAGLWPHASGDIFRPAGKSLFLTQKPYVPIGNLDDAVAYPDPADNFPPAALQAAIAAVGLTHRSGAILAEADAANGGLSGGELQRLALARLLLHRPDFAFLDEATAALDVAAEAELLARVRRDLPQTALVMVAHRRPAGLVRLRTVDLGAPREADARETREPAPA
ncbi:MAG: ABC transporter ATP-binding protein/permease [Devosia sp.]|nr:ABC transporter ATP-binding protein/permease [Devosia sp.]